MGEGGDSKIPKSATGRTTKKKKTTVLWARIKKKWGGWWGAVGAKWPYLGERFN